MGIQTVVLMFDSGLTPLFPVVLRRHSVVRAWAGGATLKHAIETLRALHTEIGQVLVDSRIMALEALLLARDRVAVSVVELFLPTAPLHFLCDAHLGATARLLRMVGFDTACNDNYADAVIEALAHEEDWIVLSRDRELLKWRGVRRSVFIRAREPQAQTHEIVTHLRLADVAKPLSRCLECNVLLRVLSPEEASASVPPHVRERQRLFGTCDVYRHVYWPGSHWMRMNAVPADILWPEAGASADSVETIEHMSCTGSADTWLLERCVAQIGNEAFAPDGEIGRTRPIHHMDIARLAFFQRHRQRTV